MYKMLQENVWFMQQVTSDITPQVYRKTSLEIAF
jgi:hypothetical protein